MRASRSARDPTLERSAPCHERPVRGYFHAMGRRCFDHLFAEASVAAGRRLPRYELWLAFHDAGLDPEQLTRAEAVSFCSRALPTFLAERGLALEPRAERRLRREISRFDPRHPTPYERFAALS